MVGIELSATFYCCGVGRQREKALTKTYSNFGIFLVLEAFMCILTGAIATPNPLHLVESGLLGYVYSWQWAVFFYVLGALCALTAYRCLRQSNS